MQEGAARYHSCSVRRNGHEFNTLARPAFVVGKMALGCRPFHRALIEAVSRRPQPDTCMRAMPGHFGSRKSAPQRGRACSSCATRIWTAHAAVPSSSPRCWTICDGSDSAGEKGRILAGRSRPTSKASACRITSLPSNDYVTPGRFFHALVRARMCSARSPLRTKATMSPFIPGPVVHLLLNVPPPGGAV